MVGNSKRIPVSAIKNPEDISYYFAISYKPTFMHIHFFSYHLRILQKYHHESARLLTLVLFADVAEHVRMDVQADVGHVCEMLACDKPDDLTDLAI